MDLVRKPWSIGSRYWSPLFERQPGRVAARRRMLGIGGLPEQFESELDLPGRGIRAVVGTKSG